MLGVLDEQVGEQIEKAMNMGCEPGDLAMGGVKYGDVSMGVRERLEGVCDAYVFVVTIRATGDCCTFRMRDGCHMSNSEALRAVAFSGKKISVRPGEVNAGRLRDQINGRFSRATARILDIG